MKHEETVLLKLDALVEEMRQVTRRLRAIEQAVTIQGTKTMSALDDLNAAVTQESTVVDSAVELLKGLADQIAASSNEPKVQQLAAQVNAQTQRLAAAVAANTPAANPGQGPTGNPPPGNPGNPPAAPSGT